MNRKHHELKGLTCAKRLMRVRKHVVVGYPPGSNVKLVSGDTLESFAGAALWVDGYHLVVQQETDRADWDAQLVAIRIHFGKDWTALFPPEDGQRFFACILVQNDVAVARGRGRA